MSVASAVVVAAVGTAAEGFGTLTVDVPRERWVEALGAAREAGATFFDLLTAYDDDPVGLAVVAHVATPDLRDHVLLRTRVPVDDPLLDTATGVYRGAGWHERETHEMFGVAFLGNDRLDPLLLGPGAATRPMRKETLLTARLERPWPGSTDPSDGDGRTRRRPLPPGVPAPGAGS